MKNIELLDNFSLSGTDADVLREKIEDITASTKELAVRGKDITFLSLCKFKDYQVKGKLSFFILSPEYLDDFVNLGKNFRVGTISLDQLGKELAEELVKTTGLMMTVGSEKYLISEKALKTLTRNSCIGGDDLINGHGFPRNFYLANAVFERNIPLRAVYRESDTGVKKVYAFFKRRYAMYPQTELLKAAENVQDGTIDKWNISTDYTDIHVRIGKKEDITPGVWFRTSDIGRSAIFSRTVVRVDDSFTCVDEATIGHNKKQQESMDLSGETDKMLKSLFKKVDAYKVLEGRDAKVDGPGAIALADYIMIKACAPLKVPMRRLNILFLDKDGVKSFRDRIKKGKKSSAEWLGMKSVLETSPFKKDKDIDKLDILKLLLRAVDMLEVNGLDEPTTEACRFIDFLPYL